MALNGGYAYTSRVQQGGLDVLTYLSTQFRHSPPSLWAARLAAGEVSVDGVPARAEAPLRAGQTVVWRRPPWDEPDVPLAFGVLYEGAELLAVDKPAGLPTLPGGGFHAHTLLTQVRRRWPGASPLHRLGRGTSGVVLFSLTPRAGAALLGEWRAGRVRKIYRALGAGVAARDTYNVTTPIGPVAHPRLGQVFAASVGGKPARSVAQVLERRADTTLFDVEIFTGRPHQIRIHLAAVGLPLTGDPLYGPGGVPRPGALPGDLGYRLHAHVLCFTPPHGGPPLTVTAPPPPDLTPGGGA